MHKPASQPEGDTDPRLIAIAIEAANEADEATRIAFWKLQGDILGSTVR